MSVSGSDTGSGRLVSAAPWPNLSQQQPLTYRITTPAATTAVTLAQVKEQLKDPDDSDEYLTLLIKAATQFFENLHNISYMDYTQQDLKKTIIIASLVEREARLEEERPIIAAVFYNRLQKGKRLESCATVQYVLGKTKERLLFSDLKVNSPYNTYIHSGLPPGPIANPGISSLNAAINPADVDFLFFVSKRDGSHYFSSTYKEHLKAIQKYSISGRVGHQVS